MAIDPGNHIKVPRGQRRQSQAIRYGITSGLRDPHGALQMRRWLRDKAHFVDVRQSIEGAQLLVCAAFPITEFDEHPLVTVNHASDTPVPLLGSLVVRLIVQELDLDL